MWKNRNNKDMTNASLTPQQSEATEEALWNLSDLVDQQRQAGESDTEVLERIANGDISQDDFAPSSDREVADAVALVAKARRSSRLLVWRRVASVAAVLLFALFAGSFLFEHREAKALTLADVESSLGRIVYMRTESFRDGALVSSSWKGGEGVFCHQNEKGKVVFVTANPEQKWEYDPKINMVTVSWPGNGYWGSQRTALESVSWLFDRYSQYALSIESISGDLDGRKVEILEIEGTQQDPLERVVVWCDPQRYLPLKIERGDRAFVFSYPEHGPESIYDMGVPDDCPVVSTVPSDEVREVIEAFYNWRQAVYDKVLKNQSFGYWTPERSGQFFEDDYSRENNLIGIEQFTQGKIFSQMANGKYSFNPPHRNRVYFSPEKDYMWVRFDMISEPDTPWQLDKTWRAGTDILAAQEKKHTIHEVTEFGQTGEGFWYPKAVERKTVKEYDPSVSTIGFDD